MAIASLDNGLNCLQLTETKGEDIDVLVFPTTYYFTDLRANSARNVRITGIGCRLTARHAQQSNHHTGFFFRPKEPAWTIPLRILLSIPIWEEPITLACILNFLPFHGPCEFIVELVTVWFMIPFLMETHLNTPLPKTGLALYVLRRRTMLFLFPLCFFGSMVLMSVSFRNTTRYDEITDSQLLAIIRDRLPLSAIIEELLPCWGCLFSLDALYLLWECRKVILRGDRLGLL